MQCKHPYYHIVEGQLVCVQCGEPAPERGKIEDKIDSRHEAKKEKFSSPKPRGKAFKKKAKVLKK